VGRNRPGFSRSKRAKATGGSYGQVQGQDEGGRRGIHGDKAKKAEGRGRRAAWATLSLDGNRPKTLSRGRHLTGLRPSCPLRRAGIVASGPLNVQGERPPKEGHGRRTEGQLKETYSAMTGDEDLKAEGRAGHADGQGSGEGARAEPNARLQNDRTVRTERTYG